jgi:pimeloyl-ACP methyl ester carboxylesterase
MLAEEAVYKVDDAEIFYRTSGEGTPLVLLHGFFGSGTMWEPYVLKLAKKYRLIIPDLRGHGRSTNPPGVFTHRQAALDIFALLDGLGVETFHAMGLSSGGMTLLHMATQQAQRVRGLALFSATSYFPEQCRAIQRGTSEDTVSWEEARQVHLRGDEQIRLLVRCFQEMAHGYDDMNFTPPYLRTISARTMIVHGDRDEFFPISIPIEMYNSIPNSALWIVPNAGHDLISRLGGADGASQEFLDMVIEFWEGK